MTFRSRVALTLGLGAMIPLALLAFGVRREMTQRLTAQADDRISAQIEKARDGLAADSRAIDGRLERLTRSLTDNNQFRLAVVSGQTSRPWLLDWAGEAMLQSDLTVLELVDSAGRILSSGHFRNEFGQEHRGLTGAVERDSTVAVLRARTPGGQHDALVRGRSFVIAGRRLALIGGRELDPGRLVAADPELAAELAVGSSDQAGRGPGVATIPVRLLTFEDTLVVTPAAIVLTRNLGPVLALRRSVDRWFLGAAGVLLLVTISVALWLSSRVTRPLADLAAKTAQVDLDRLDQSFGTGRSDEIGVLAGMLDTMTERLRASVTRLREAERRAATGDLARQINHDVKNGLAPIRHVLRHLGQVAREQPAELAAIYGERVGTLESSVEYLENLSRNYARLSPTLDRGETEPNVLLREITVAVAGPVPIDLRLEDSPPNVRCDAVTLRRIVENLVTNAVDAAREVGGRVTLTTETARRDGTGWVRFIVADSGKGMTREQLDQAFDDFFTTKTGGTGLGLSVVRRLVADLGGSLRVETAPGQGSQFIVELPAGGGS
jgi:signal transduction histidine kinase